MFDKLFSQYGSIMSILLGVLVGFIVFKKTRGSWPWTLAATAAVTVLSSVVTKKLASSADQKR
jgi:hypothetical protein